MEKPTDETEKREMKSSKTIRSLGGMYCSAILIFVASLAKALIGIWLPYIRGEEIVLTQHDTLVMGLELVPIFFEVIGFIGVSIYFAGGVIGRMRVGDLK